MMIKCPNCGLMISSNLKRCFACDYPLEDLNIPTESEAELVSEPEVDPEPDTTEETSVVTIEPVDTEISDPAASPVEPFNWRRYLKIGLAILAGFVLLMIYVGSSSEDRTQASVDEAAKSALTEPVTQEVSEETAAPQSEEASESEDDIPSKIASEAYVLLLQNKSTDTIIAELKKKGYSDEDIAAGIEKLADVFAEVEKEKTSDSTVKNDGDNSSASSESQALKSARKYLEYQAFSHDGLIEQLKFEGFSTEEATAAADQCGADWNEQALKSAKNYLEHQSFSYKGLVEQLEFSKFTTEQAEYGVKNCGADWNEQAAKKAANYLDHQSFSQDGLVEQLEYEGFTPEQAAYGVGEVYE